MRTKPRMTPTKQRYEKGTLMSSKKILFVINTMGQGGAEVAMLELMKALPKMTDCQIDLYVMMGQGELIDSVPPQVNLLNRHMDASDVLSSAGRIRLYRHTALRLLSRFSGVRNLPYIIKNYRVMRRTGTVIPKNLLWKAVSDGTKPPREAYDMAIAYIEGASTYYVADRVNAGVKVAFVHTDYHKAGYHRQLDHGCYDAFAAVYCVSEDVREVFLSEYPELEARTHVFRNIIDPESILEKSTAGKGFDDDFDGVRIVSVGRLVRVKAYDTAIEAAAILTKRGHRIRWYVFGEGEERAALENEIKARSLENTFILCGTVRNPFPYLRASQIYVQCSRYEGQSVAVREAKVLGMPIVLTLSHGTRDQLTDGVDGIFVGADARSVADGIERLIKDPGLRERLGREAAKIDPTHEDALQLVQMIKK